MMSETSETTGPGSGPILADAAWLPARHLAAVRTLYDASPIGAAAWSVRGELLHANPVFADLVGRTSEQLVGERFGRFIDSDDEANVLRAIEELWQGTSNYFECDLRGRDSDGAELWLRAHLHAVYGDDGRPAHLVSQVFSLAGRRGPHARAAHRGELGFDDGLRTALVAESPALLWGTDTTGTPRTGNARVAELLGLPAGTTELPGSLFDTVHPDDRAALDAEIRARVEAREPFELTARSCRADGEWRWLLHRARPVFSAHGGFTGYAGVSVDVTVERERFSGLEAVAHNFKRVTESGPVAVLRTDAAGEVVYANDRWATLIDDPVSRLAGGGWRDILLPDHVDRIHELAAESVETRQPFQLRVRAQDTSVAPHRPSSSGVADGCWADLAVAPLFAADGSLDGFVATIADVSAQVAAHERATRLAEVLAAGSDYVVVVERNGAISYVNQAAREELGIELAPRGDPATFLLDVLMPDAFAFFHEEIEPILAASHRWTGELAMRAASGVEVPVSVLALAHTDEDGRVGTITVSARDISDQKQAHARMQQLATHDYLTGLPNRVLLYEHLDQALARYKRHSETVALLYLDLDRFKPINDRFGHHVGDAVLVALADRMHEVVRDTDTAARVGGDEFAVLVQGYESQALLERVAERLITALSKPIQAEGTTVNVGVSIGIVAADDTTADADTLLARGDAAMYAAKAAGRGRYVFAPAEGEVRVVGHGRPDLAAQRGGDDPAPPRPAA